MALATGSTLGSYTILAPLGAGGMGEVYRARDPRLGREVAVKVLPSAMAGDPDRLARFEREARAVAALSHPHIVTIHSIEEAGGVRFLTMELVEGDTLDRVVPTGGLPVARALELGVALSDALAAAHDKGVVHRDLKPANVMVTGDGRLKVLDFGLARHAATQASGAGAGAATMEAPISAAGYVVGTVPYMAPEQVRGEPVDARADLFSFGILLYEMLSGRRPFAGQSWADVSSSILRDVPVPLVTLRPGLPGDLERIVARCLDKDRERRFQTARDVRNELDLVRRGSSTAAVTRERAFAATADLPSVAVLPFANRSANEEDEYFSDGLADELLNVLARIRGLRVAARTSSATFKGKAVPIAEVGETLKVAAVLEGSVRRAGNRVRIAVQLVQVRDGYPLWSETYDRTLDDIFAVQDDIAQSVVKELRTRLLGEAPDSEASREVKAEVAKAGTARGTNPEAHRRVLQARHLLARVNEADNRKAITHLEQALALEPDNAHALVELSAAHMNAAGYGWDPMVEATERARKAALDALARAPDLPEAHLVLARIHVFYDWDRKAARASIGRALDLVPDHAEGLRMMAQFATDLGELPDAIARAERAVELDPLSPTACTTLGFLLRAAGRAAEAVTAYERMLELTPQRTGGRLLLGLALWKAGRLEDALTAIEEEPATWAKLTGLAAFHHLAGRKTESDAAFEELVADHADSSAYQIAAVCAVRGEREAMFSWLDHALETRDAGLAFAPLEVVFQPYHEDPRWAELRKMLGLESASSGGRG